MSRAGSPDREAGPPTRASWLTRNVVALGLVSLLTDSASEMIVPLLPAFLTGVLGGGPVALGWIEGLADATASVLKLVSGRWADRMGRNRPLVIAGYTLSSIARPLVALAASPWHVLAIRLADRTGKGVRSSPRDALITASVREPSRASAFGFQRGMDHAGAVLGPLLALGILALRPGDLRLVFALSAIPGALVLAALLAGVREEHPRRERSAETSPLGAWPDRKLASILVPVGVFALGNSSDLFLLLAAGAAGSTWHTLPLIWAGLHVVKVGASLLGGPIADRWSRRNTIIAGWALYAAVYAGLAAVRSPLATSTLVLVYGIHHGLTEGPERALVAQVAAESGRGTAFGWYHLTGGLLALPASILFGALWQAYGRATAFLAGAALALAAALLLALLVREDRGHSGLPGMGTP